MMTKTKGLPTMFVIFEVESTRFARVFRNGYWQDAKSTTKGGATRLFNSLVKAGKISAETHRIEDADVFHAHIEKTEERVNFMSKEKFTCRVNANYATCPSSETYWST